MTFLVAEVVAKYGIPGLLAATLIAALLQLLAGALRLGRFMQLVPRPVIAGFLSGIGLTILCTRLPVVLGYELSRTEEGGALAMLWETLRQLRRPSPRRSRLAWWRPPRCSAFPGSRGGCPPP